MYAASFDANERPTNKADRLAFTRLGVKKLLTVLDVVIAVLLTLIAPVTARPVEEKVARAVSAVEIITFPEIESKTKSLTVAPPII